MQQPSSPADNERDAQEQRRHARHKRLVPVLLSDGEAKAKPARAWVGDCSLGGLRLLVHQEVAPGTVLTVRPVNAPANFRWLKLEVRTCQAVEVEGNWELGCQFLRTPSYSTLLLFR